MTYVVTPPQIPSLPIRGISERMPVHRIYCVGRNYTAHAQEMGFTGREEPFFFVKPGNTLLPIEEGEAAVFPYPSLTANLQHEIELVVAIGKGGKNILAQNASQHIYGYAVGLDMTRRDLQEGMKKQGRPWSIGKSFDRAAPVGQITRKEYVCAIKNAEVWLQVNGQTKQQSQITQLIWNIDEIIAKISCAWELVPGDLIFTGTPEGVSSVRPGDTLYAGITGLDAISLHIKNQHVVA